MEVNTHINKCIVYIIESLPDGDLRTGRNLDEKLKQEWLYNDDYDSIYKVVNYKGELKQILFEIAEIVKAQDNHTFYILQFEAHGSERGMHLSSNEVVTWGELFSMIRPINIYMNDTLFVVLSMCDSKCVAYHIEPNERSPFRGVVVTGKPLSAKYLDSIWENFYKEFMSRFLEGKTEGYISDFTPEHIWFLNQEFIFDIHSDLEEYHPELFLDMKDGFADEYDNLFKSHPNEIFFIAPRDLYMRWRVNTWRRDKQRLRDYFCFNDILGKYKDKENKHGN